MNGEEVIIMSAKCNIKKCFAVFLSILMLSGPSISCFAQPAHEGSKRPGKMSARTVKKSPAPQHKSFVESRYHHNRSYPQRGYAVRSLPRGHRVVLHHNDRYYSSHGVWYRHHHGRYVVVAPPIGLFVPFLPLAYATLWMNGIPYYYANETYYTHTPGGYVVVEPPQGEVSKIPPNTEEDITGDRLFIYPSRGQSQAQQDKDRYECHQWAVEQTDYDPTQPQDEIPMDEIIQQRKDYRRAMTTCLDSRGYAVK
jgi:hypothetical protein